MTFKWTLALVGMLAGFLIGVISLLNAYKQVPGTPGIFEVAVQVVIVGLLSSALGVVGFGLGCVLDLFTNRRRKKNGT